MLLEGGMELGGPSRVAKGYAACVYVAVAGFSRFIDAVYEF